MCDYIADAASIPDDQQFLVKFKELANPIETLKSAFSDAKSGKHTVQEEDTRNRLVYQKLYMWVSEKVWFYHCP